MLKANTAHEYHRMLHIFKAVLHRCGIAQFSEMHRN